MYFRRLSEVPSHWKFLVSSVLSKLDKQELSKRAILLMLRNHHSREEKLLLVVRVARKQKEREFWEVSWLTLYPLKCTARGICWLRTMYHQFGWWLQKGQSISFFIIFFPAPNVSFKMEISVQLSLSEYCENNHPKSYQHLLLWVCAQNNLMHTSCFSVKSNVHNDGQCT